MVTMIVEKEGDPFSVAWSWVIETLADTEQVNTPLLHDLVQKVPNAYNSLSNNTKERLAFRHLEHISHTPILSDDSPASSLHRLCADLLVPAQDVYCRLLVEEIDASSARTVHDFVLRKRVQLPKCSLQELEDLLTNGSNPIAASLRKASGLTIEQGEDCSRESDQIQTPEPDSTHLAPENLDNRMQDDWRVESPISTAKAVMEMQTDFTRFVAENLDNIMQDDGGPKSPNSATNIDMDMQVDSTRFVSEILDNLVQDVCSAKSPDSTTKINVEAQDDFTRLVSENLTNLAQDCIAKSPNSTTKMDTKIVQADSTHLVPENTDTLVPANYSAKSPKSSTKIYMEMESFDKDPIEIDLSEYDYCVKCKKRGELLVCSGSACRISVHKSCLDCEPSFDGMGNFHCPICLNLQASIVLQQKKKKFERAREKVMLAKAQLDKYNTWKAENEAQTKAGTRNIEG